MSSKITLPLLNSKPGARLIISMRNEFLDGKRPPMTIDDLAAIRLLPLRIVFKIRVIRSIGKEIRLSCQVNLLNWFSENFLI